MNLKQFFCDHIWAVEGTKVLQRYRESYVGIVRVYYYVDTVEYASYEVCLECGKKRTKEKTINILVKNF